MYKCLIVDDEPIARRIIKNHLAFFEQFSVEAECSNALEAIPILSKKKVDLLFCDIQMPQITGVEFIRSLTHPPDVIFTTAYRDYAVDAFELNVVDYLIKPISFERFAKSINRFLEGIEGNNTGETATADAQAESDFIFLKADKKHHKIELKDFLWAESLGDYIQVFTSSGKITVKERISALAELLPTNRFIRIHRGFVVSIHKIEAIGPGFVEINKTKLPIGRLYKKEVDQLLNSSNKQE